MRTLQRRTMGGTLITTNSTINGHCYEPNNCLSPVHMERVRAAIIETERLCARDPRITASNLRVTVVNVTSLTPITEPLVDALQVVLTPRYDVRKREAPKRPNLIRRLLGMLR